MVQTAWTSGQRPETSAVQTGNIAVPATRHSFYAPMGYTSNKTWNWHSGKRWCQLGIIKVHTDCMKGRLHLFTFRLRKKLKSIIDRKRWWFWCDDNQAGNYPDPTQNIRFYHFLSESRRRHPGYRPQRYLFLSKYEENIGSAAVPLVYIEEG